MKIFPGVRISGSTRRRRRRSSTQRRKTTQHWTHPYCTTQHRSEQAANKCANSPAVRQRRAAAELQARRNAELIEQRAVERAAAKGARQQQKAWKGSRWPFRRSPSSIGFETPNTVGPPAAIQAIPASTTSSKAQVRPAGWAFLYLAQELERAFERHEAEYREHEKHRIQPTGERVEGPADLSRRFDELKACVAKGKSVLNPERLGKAFSLDGINGDEAVMRSIALGLEEMYVSLMEWARTARGVSVPTTWRAVYLALSEFADSPIRDLRQFSNELSLQLRDLARATSSGLPQGDLHMTLKLRFDDNVHVRYNAAFDKAKGFLSPPSSA